MACDLCAAQSAIDLGTAGNFAILSQSGITDVPTSAITGDVGSSPITGAAIGVTCTEVTGAIYDNDGGYTGGGGGNTACRVTDAALLTTAVNSMQAAYTDAATRTPDQTGVGAGDISGMTLMPGIYKWTTGLQIETGISPDTNGVTLDCQGNTSAVYIFQIAQTLKVYSGAVVTLSGGCQAKNIFWQVAGTTELGTTSVFNGNILAGPGASTIALLDGATLCGRALAQKDVTLISSKISLTCGNINPTATTTTTTTTTSSTSTTSSTTTSTTTTSTTTSSSTTTTTTSTTTTTTTTSSSTSTTIPGIPAPEFPFNVAPLVILGAGALGAAVLAGRKP